MDFDKLGIRLTKKKAGLYNIDIKWWQDAVDYIKKQLADRGYVVNRAELDPHTERWLFYEDEVLVVAVAPDLVDKVASVLWEREHERDTPGAG